MTGSSHSHLQETALTGSRQDITRRVALVGMSINIFLTIAQVIGGILTHSQALIADAMHTLSDLAGDIVVLFASHHAGKDADEKHPYGHGRIETLATVVLGLLLGAVAVIIFLRAWDRLGVRGRARPAGARGSDSAGRQRGSAYTYTCTSRPALHTHC